MKKIKLTTITIFSICVALVFAFPLISCKTAVVSETSIVETTVAAGTTVAETTVAVETTIPPKDIYTYEKLREMAKTGQYEGEPAKGHKLAFANVIDGPAFCEDVKNGIKKQWELAGGNSEDLTLLDNKADVATALKNEDIVFSKKPEVFIEFQADSKVNAMIGRKAQEEGLFVIAVDITVPGFPFMGVENYKVGKLTGQWLVDNIDKKFGSWDSVDLVLVVSQPAAGEAQTLRVAGQVDAFKDVYGDSANPDVKDSKLILVEAWLEDNARENMSNALAAYPNAKNIILSSYTDYGIVAFKSVLEDLGKWDKSKILVGGLSGGESFNTMIRENTLDAYVSFFPEKYGEYLVPGALAFMYDNPVPAYMFVDNEVITLENIDQFYPVK